MEPKATVGDYLAKADAYVRAHPWLSIAVTFVVAAILF